MRKGFTDSVFNSIMGIVGFIVLALFIAGFIKYIEYQCYPSNHTSLKIEDVHKNVDFYWDPIISNKMHVLLDVIHGDPEGKKLLIALAENNVHIKIINWGQTRYSWDNNIYIDRGYIEQAVNFSIGNQYNKYGSNQIENLMVVLHEIGHAIMADDDYINTGKRPKTNKKYKATYDSKEEELSVTMIGMNIASRILQNRNLTGEEATNYIEKYCRSMENPLDSHSSLPPYNNYIQGVQERYGITVPYGDIIIQKIRQHF